MKIARIILTNAAIVLMILLSIGVASAANLTDNVIGAWNFTVTDGDVIDLTNLGNNFSNVGATEISTPYDALSYDGVDDQGDFISLPITYNVPSSHNVQYLFKDTDNFTVSFWYNGTDTEDVDKAKVIFGTDQTSGLYAQIGLDQGYPTYAHYDTSWLQTKGSTLVADGNLHHVVFVQQANETMYIYVDGVLDGSGSSSISDANRNFSIRHVMYGTLGSLEGVDWTEGDLFSAAIWNRSLNSSDITNLYNGGVPLDYPFVNVTTPPEDQENLTITVTNSWDNSGVNNITAVITEVGAQSLNGSTLYFDSTGNDRLTFASPIPYLQNDSHYIEITFVQDRENDPLPQLIANSWNSSSNCGFYLRNASASSSQSHYCPSNTVATQTLYNTDKLYKFRFDRNGGDIDVTVTYENGTNVSWSWTTSTAGKNMDSFGRGIYGGYFVGWLFNLEINGVTYNASNNWQNATISGAEATNLTLYYYNGDWVNESLYPFGTYTNATGNYINTNISLDAGTTADIQIITPEHFDRNITGFVVNEILTQTLNQSFISFQNFEVYTSNSLAGNFTVTDGVTTYNGGNTTQTLKAGSYNITGYAGGDYYSVTASFTVNPLDVKTINLTGFYNAVFNITGYDNWSSEDISNFTVNTVNAALGVNLTLNTTGTDLNITPLLQGYNYTLQFSSPFYNDDGTVLFSNASKVDYQFVLNPYNAVNISFIEYNGSVITGEQINVTFFYSNATFSNTTTTGNLEISLLLPSDYEMRITSTNYLYRLYFFTVTDNSAQQIYVYLTPNATTELQVFRVLDTTNLEVQGAKLRVEKQTSGDAINLWTNYAEETTNAEGKANIYLEKGIENYYRFAVIYEGQSRPIYPSGSYYTSKTNFIAGVSETVEIVVTLDEAAIDDYYSDLYGVVYETGFSDNNTFWFSWLDAQNSIAGAKLLIYGKFLDNTTAYELLDTQTSTSTNGNISYTFTPINNTIYQAKAYISYNSYDYLVHTETKSYNVSATVNKNTGLLYAAGILIVTALITIYLGVLLSAVLTFLMLVFTNLVGFTNLPVTVITAFLALAIILLIKITKNDEG